MTRRLTGLAVIAAASTLAACGVNNKEAGKSAVYTAPTTSQATKTTEQQAQRRRQEELEKRRAALPRPTPGVVTVDSASSLGISAEVQDAFAKRSDVVVQPKRSSDAAAFRDLCDGKVDVVESSGEMSASQLARCAANGVDLPVDGTGRVAPLVLAADAIVLATRNQTDVGGDCLRRDTIRSVFGSGSSLTNWSQLGFDDVPLTTTGRNAGSLAFNLFGDVVLGASGDAERSDLRPDYRAFSDDASVLDAVTANRRRARATAAAQRDLRRRLKAARPRVQRARDAAVRKADREFQQVVKRENAERARKKLTLTPTQVRQISTSNLARVQRRKKVAGDAAAFKITGAITRDVRAGLRSRLAALNQAGVVGYFRFTYYELYEEQLRPLEVWDPNVAQQIAERQGVATNRTRKQPVRSTATQAQADGTGQTATSQRITYPPTPTAPGSTYVAASGGKVTVPASGPVDVDKTPACIYPSRPTIASGIYPLSTRLLAYVSKAGLERREVKEYLAYYLGKGQDVVAAERLVPLGEDVRASEYKLVTGKDLNGGSGSAATPGRSGTGTTSTGTATTPLVAPSAPGTPSGVPGVDGGQAR